MDTLTIEIKLPPKPLSPNSRCHWAKRAKAVKAYRNLACLLAKEQIGRGEPPRWTKALCLVSFHWAHDRVHDEDNAVATLKAAFDGLADAGVVINDSGLTPRLVVSTFDRSRPRVVLKVIGVG